MNGYAWIQKHASTQGRERKKKEKKKITKKQNKNLTKPTYLKGKHWFFFLPGSDYVYKMDNMVGAKKTLIKILLENHCC